MIGLTNIMLWSCGEIELLVKAFLYDNVVCCDAKHIGYQSDSSYEISSYWECPCTIYEYLHS